MLFPTGTILLNGVVSDQVKFLRLSFGLRLNEIPWGCLPICYTTSDVLGIDLIVNAFGPQKEMLIQKKLNGIKMQKKKKALTLTVLFSYL